jgi:sugar lactone lactonase YvrE
MKFHASSLSRLICVIVLLLAPTTVALSQTAPRKIAYAYGNTSSTIAVINEDGSGQTKLTSEGFNDRYPAWSPDGSQIVFQSNRYAGRYNILRMNADGTGLVPLTDFALPNSSTDPSWSPDGTKILFVSDRGGARRSEIWVMNADGTNPIRLTTNVQIGSDGSGPFYAFDLEPAWSPDGSKIVFRSFRNTVSTSELYSINADGSNLVRLTNNTAEDKEPAWSPDGQHIAFWSRGGGRAGIYVIDANGANDHLISFNGSEPAWSPDGSKLVITDFDPQANYGLALYLINSDGSNPTRLTNNGTVASVNGAWQTTGGTPPPPPPGPPAFSVSGRVVDSSAINPVVPGVTPGVPGVTLSLTGSASATTITDANGNFLIGNLPENGSFTLTPSTPNWGMFPTSLSFSTSYPFIGFVGRNLATQFNASPIFLQFLSNGYSAQEGSSATITVERYGSITITSTIDYATSDGTAKAGADYVATSGTLRFNPGEQLKSFTVPIIYDKTPEPSETINLTLTNPTGSTARGRQTTVLTISDPPPELIREANTSQAVALNAETWTRDPFTLTTNSFFGQDPQTRIVLFARFVDLLPSEDLTAVTVQAFTSQSAIFQLPVEFVGPVANLDGATQINVRLPANLPTGDLFITVTLRGMASSPAGIRIR